VEFEYDLKKNRKNKLKHGVDFETAEKLWQGPSVEFAAKSEYENRFAIIGMLKGKLFTCIYTLRNSRIRIISCRRSREMESNFYEKSIQKTEKR
jgi:uncharacterized DUF497 family protein